MIKLVKSEEEKALKRREMESKTGEDLYIACENGEWEEAIGMVEHRVPAVYSNSYGV